MSSIRATSIHLYFIGAAVFAAALSGCNFDATKHRQVVNHVVENQQKFSELIDEVEKTGVSSVEFDFLKGGASNLVILPTDSARRLDQHQINTIARLMWDTSTRMISVLDNAISFELAAATTKNRVIKSWLLEGEDVILDTASCNSQVLNEADSECKIYLGNGRTMFFVWKNVQ